MTVTEAYEMLKSDEIPAILAMEYASTHYQNRQSPVYAKGTADEDDFEWLAYDSRFVKELEGLKSVG